MTKYFALVFLTLSTLAFTTLKKEANHVQHTTQQATGIKWLTFDQALAAQKKNPKKIMIDAYTDWCGPCKMLDKNTFQNADVIKYVNANYYAVKFDAEGNEKITYKGKSYGNPQYDPTKDKTRNSAHELAYQLGVQAYPTIIFMDEQANVLSPVRGYQTPQQLEIYLKLFATNDFKNVKTQEQWTQYQQNFKPVFK